MDQGDTDGADLQRELEAALEQVAERDALAEALRAARDAVRTTREDDEAARILLAAETEDVERLERFSFARLAASLRGTTFDDLAREKAEQARAHAEADVARARLDAALARVEEIERRAHGLRDVDLRLAHARAAKERWFLASGHPEAARLADVAASLAAARAEAGEVEEAERAAASAAQHLERALKALDAAGGWSSYDAFFGGGFVADTLKYDALDRARDDLALAEAALRRLDAELQDVRIVGVGGDLRIDGSTRVVDFLLDDIFTAWRVHGTIRTARERAAAAAQGVAAVRRTLAERAGACTGRIKVLEAEREQVLAAAGV